MIASTLILAAVLAANSPAGTDTAHDGILNVPCVECHAHLPFSKGVPSLRTDVSDVCSNRCHQKSHGTDAMRSHPINVVPSMRIPPDMMQNGQNKIVCVTCHTFHGEYRDESGNKQYYLRRPRGKAFCYSCHKMLPGPQQR